MKFTDIYNQTIHFWPQSICIDDGEVREDNGGYFPTLSKISWDVEEATKSENDWVQLMVWAIFCGYHRQAVAQLKSGKRYIFSDNIDKNYTESKFSESLFSSDCGYEKMRDLYINDLITHPKSLS